MFVSVPVSSRKINRSGWSKNQDHLFSQRYERGATLITSNLPFDEWTETFGTERLTGALLDRLREMASGRNDKA